jgi:ABC-type dipeptide/oligopeptide/nickel transport system permease component
MSVVETCHATEEGIELTSFPFGERYVTSRFVLDKLDLDFAPSCLLLRFGLLFIVVVVAAALGSIMVVNERVIGDRGGLAGVCLGVCGCYVSWMHVECALTFAHIKSDASEK